MLGKVSPRLLRKTYQLCYTVARAVPAATLRIAGLTQWIVFAENSGRSPGGAPTAAISWQETYAGNEVFRTREKVTRSAGVICSTRKVASLKRW